MAKNQRNLRNILLNPQFQLRLIGYFLGLFVLTTVSLYSTSFLFFWRLKQKALNVGIPKQHVFFTFLEGQKMELDLLFIALAFINLILLLGTGFIVSHRIAGPIHKLKNHLGQISQTSNSFKLRKKDFFKELEPVVDELKEKLK